VLTKASKEACPWGTTLIEW